MSVETEKLKLFYQKQSKLIGFVGLILSLVSTLVYLGISIGEQTEKIETLQSLSIETKANIRDIDNEISAMGVLNSEEHNDFTNNIILIQERLEVLRKQLETLERRNRLKDHVPRRRR